MKRMMASVFAAMMVSLLLASPAAVASPGSGSASVTLHIAVAAKVDYTVVDHDHIDLRSNASWRLVLYTPHGVRTVTGGPTGNTPVRLELPAGTTDYFVTLDRR
jgi:hypothetical protein